MPSSKPSTIPSLSPATSQPSSQPVMTGLVITVDVSTPTTEALTPEEIVALENTILGAYDISSDDIATSIGYTVSGELDLSLPEDTTEAELADAVINLLAEQTGVHPREVTIDSINLETGEVSYTISTDDFDNTQQIQQSH